jgi:TRAP-type C4-dicarboxylate transport system permease small subunit
MEYPGEDPIGGGAHAQSDEYPLPFPERGDPSMTLESMLGRPSEARMPWFIVSYVRYVDRLGRGFGVIAMILTYVLAGILLESSLARVLFGVSHIWSVEMAQFAMSAYYLLGGAISEQDDYHVRMDLFYSRLSPRLRVILDCITAPIVIFYLFFLFAGGISSSHWAIVNDQVNYTAWAPPMAPIKIIMTVGIGLMLLQIVAIFFKDLARLLGRPIE